MSRMWPVRSVGCRLWYTRENVRRRRDVENRMAEMARQINEQTLRAQEAQARLAQMMAERRKVAEEVERAWREREAQREAQA